MGDIHVKNGGKKEKKRIIFILIFVKNRLDGKKILQLS